MKEFLHEWWRLLIWPAPWLYQGKDMILSGCVLLAKVGIVGAIPVYYLDRHFDIPWWVIAAGAIVICWLSLTVGMALERSREAKVTIGPVLFNSSTKTFQLLLINGDLKARITLQINNVFSADGTRFLTAPLYRVAISATPNHDFLEGEERQFPLCRLGETALGHPCLIIDQQKNTDGRVTNEEVIVTEELEMRKQTPVRFQIIVTTQTSGQSAKNRTYNSSLTFKPDESLA